MDKVDFVLVGSEAVVESGGLVNAVGSNQMAIIAKAENKPFYALAERYVPVVICDIEEHGSPRMANYSYKFRRLFPLSQYDLPTHTPGILSFPQSTQPSSDAEIIDTGPALPVLEDTSKLQTGSMDRLLTPTFLPQTSVVRHTMTSEQLANNPDVDYTR